MSALIQPTVFNFGVGVRVRLLAHPWTALLLAHFSWGQMWLHKWVVFSCISSSHLSSGDFLSVHRIMKEIPELFSKLGWASESPFDRSQIR